jgi:hypothetical protein
MFPKLFTSFKIKSPQPSIGSETMINFEIPIVMMLPEKRHLSNGVCIVSYGFSFLVENLAEYEPFETNNYSRSPNQNVHTITVTLSCPAEAFC